MSTLVDTELGWIDRRTTMNRTCRGCGCDDLHSCPGGCSWVLLDIETPSGVCSVCAEALGWDAYGLAIVGNEDALPLVVPNATELVA